MFSDGFIGSLWTIYGRAHKFTSALVFLRTLVLITQHQLPRPVQQISHRLRRYPHLPGSLCQRLPFQHQPRCFAGSRRQGWQIEFTRLIGAAKPAVLFFCQYCFTFNGGVGALPFLLCPDQRQEVLAQPQHQEGAEFHVPALIKIIDCLTTAQPGFLFGILDVIIAAGGFLDQWQILFVWGIDRFHLLSKIIRSLRRVFL